MKVIIIALLAAAVLPAQTFEVASVKRSAPETGSGSRSTGAIPRQQEPGRINYPNVKLKGVIAIAYGVDAGQIGGPSWLDDERYDIVAKLPDDAPQDQLPVMLQHLLADRFHMTVHEETKPRNGFALLAGKGPLKAKAVEEGESMGFEVQSDRVLLKGMTMAQFAKFLSGRTGPPVSDETNIAGHYDITLDASMSDIQAGLFSGAVEDIGLKLEKRTVPAKFITVEKADKIPTEN